MKIHLASLSISCSFQEITGCKSCCSTLDVLTLSRHDLTVHQNTRKPNYIGLMIQNIFRINSDQGVVHTVYSTDVPITTSRQAATQERVVPPTPRPETLTPVTEITVGRQPTVLIPEVSHFQRIDFDLSGLTAEDSLSIAGTPLERGTSWEVKISTYQGHIFVDLNINGEYSRTSQINELPVKMQIEIRNGKLVIHTISAIESDERIFDFVEPDELTTPHRVTIQQTAGSSQIIVHNLSVQ